MESRYSAIINIKQVEMLGVLMRIFSFALVSWFGESSPFMLVWSINTMDAIILTICSIKKRDSAYTLLNGFWILVGAIGIMRAGGVMH
jgi:hypothetical protein